MSFANPTALRVGMNGTLAGKRYRVAGRVVVGMDDEGETYYWNEFNLAADDGETATLVYEITEDGGEWRLFTMFEPEYPITAPDAATKRVGDRLNLDGTEVPVTLVDKSRVYHIEGQAPEGVEVGDVAHYFNAESGNTMQVVSWTGDEVECYNGTDLARGVVSVAFDLPYESAPTRGALAGLFGRGSDDAGAGEQYDSVKRFVAKAVGVVLAAAIGIAGYSFWSKSRKSAGRKMPAPASPLVVGSSGKLGDKNYRIRGHALVEIAEVGRIFERHEYRLVDLDDAEALLIFGLTPGAKDWVMFKPLQPSNPLTPNQAAALRIGETVKLEGYVARVEEMFQVVIRRKDGDESADAKSNSVTFGLAAHSGSTPLLVRWSHDGISFYSGRTLAGKEVTAAFASAARP